MEKIIESFINSNEENFYSYFEDYRFKKLQKNEQYESLRKEKNRIFEKYPDVRKLFEDEKGKGYSQEENEAIEDVLRIESTISNIEIKEAFKLGAKEFILFAIEQDLIKRN